MQCGFEKQEISHEVQAHFVFNKMPNFPASNVEMKQYVLLIFPLNRSFAFIMKKQIKTLLQVLSQKFAFLLFVSLFTLNILLLTLLSIFFLFIVILLLVQHLYT